MAAVERRKHVKAGDWRTLESGLNANFRCQFRDPVGARVKVRYGLGWLGWDSQKKTLDGTDKILRVGGPVYARVQMKVSQDVDVTYLYLPG
jgi:hypothetical protein